MASFYGLHSLSLVMTMLLAVLVASLVATAVNNDECKDSGEMRRRYSCAAITHHKGNVCCFKRDDGVDGIIPTACCGTGWISHECETIVDRICEAHDDEL